MALTTIQAKDGVPVWANVSALIDEWEPNLLVVGLPYNMDGSESAMSVQVLTFIENLSSRYKLPVATIDERLTSSEAHTMLRAERSAGQRRRKLRPGDIDSVAAKLIAENWIADSINETNES